MDSIPPTQTRDIERSRVNRAINVAGARKRQEIYCPAVLLYPLHSINGCFCML